MSEPQTAIRLDATATVRLAVTGVPDLPDHLAGGLPIVPAEVTLTYRWEGSDQDGRPTREVRAEVRGPVRLPSGEVFHVEETRLLGGFDHRFPWLVALAGEHAPAWWDADDAPEAPAEDGEAARLRARVDEAERQLETARVDGARLRRAEQRRAELEAVLGTHRKDDQAEIARLRARVAELEGAAARTDDDGEWVLCSGLHCKRSERYARATERGWEHGHMDTWQCPQCATANRPTVRQPEPCDLPHPNSPDRGCVLTIGHRTDIDHQDADGGSWPWDTRY